MPLILHFLAKSADPRIGGLQHSVGRIAAILARVPDTKVRVYTFGDEEGLDSALSSQGVEVENLKSACDGLCRPLRESDATPARQSEKYQAYHLIYCAALRRAMARAPDARHLVMSFFISQIGFVAQQVADTLKLPHVAFVRGSDFNRDFRSPQAIAAAKHVIERASWIITTNVEQLETIRYIFGRDHRLINAANSISLPEGTPVWAPHRRPGVQLISDTGYSFKKGTHLLLEAVAELAGEGVPLKLRLVGHVERLSAPYWESLRERYQTMLPHVFQLRGWVPDSEMVKLILESDIYCSATLGEGCSNGRLRALTLGAPLATTRCGEMVGLLPSADHVRMAEPGDGSGYKQILSQMCAQILDGTMQTSPGAVAEWRLRFSPESEFRHWCRILTEILIGSANKP